MTYLMQLAQNISYVSVDQISLLGTLVSTVSLLALAYNPSFPNLVYALYGSQLETNYYDDYILQTWMTEESSGHTLLSNTSLQVNLTCTYGNCQMEVSSNLLLIQSPYRMVLFKVNASSSLILSSYPVRTIDKGNATFTSSNGTYRLATIKENIFYRLAASQYGNLIVQVYNASGITTANYSYILPSSPLGVSASNSLLLIAYNMTHLKFIPIPCSAIIPTSSDIVGFLNISLYTPVNVGVSAADSLKMVQGYSQVYDLILWLTADGKAFRYNLQYVPVSQLESNTSEALTIASASTHYVLFYYNSLFMLKSFTSDADSLKAIFPLSNNNHQLAVLTHYFHMIVVESPNLQITQYQLVNNCSSFLATYNSQTQMCQCGSYSKDSIFYCSSSLSYEGSSLSFPVIIGAAVGGIVVLVIITWVLYKKVCVKMGKPVRKPYKYNPVELMSFQV